jgi:hypothetical protein
MIRPAVILATLLLFPYAAKAQERGHFRESNGRIIRVPVKQNEERLRYIAFVKFDDGSVMLPRMYYGQKHFTRGGVATVEKLGPMGSIISPHRKEIILPKGDEISAYRFLVCRPVIVRAYQYGQMGNVTRWTDCALYEIAASDLLAEKELNIPAFAELEKQRESRRHVFDDLQKRFTLEEAKAKKAGSKPITADTVVPWWAQ